MERKPVPPSWPSSTFVFPLVSHPPLPLFDPAPPYTRHSTTEVTYTVCHKVQDSSQSSFAGTLVLSASQTEEKDTLWMVDSDLFPFQTSCMESHVSHMTAVCT